MKHERDALARANAVLQQQAQMLATLQGLHPSAAAPSYVLHDQVCATVYQILSRLS